MKVFATNYEADCSWIPEYTDEYIIYDRSDCGLPNRVPRENVGDADYDKLTFLVENYNNLPDVFLFTKSNLFKFITHEEWDKVKNNQEFTPLLTQNHKTYSDEKGQVCFYEDGVYAERNDSWYLGSVPSKSFKDYSDFAHTFKLPSPKYLKFAPGGNYILTKECVHRYARDYYDELRSILPYCQRPGEAHFIERTYWTLWS